VSAEFKEYRKRLKAAQTISELLRIETSMARLWVAGFMTEKEFARLDALLIDKKITLED
jgi:hypothetical protein